MSWYNPIKYKVLTVLDDGLIVDFEKQYWNKYDIIHTDRGLYQVMDNGIENIKIQYIEADSLSELIPENTSCYCSNMDPFGEMFLKMFLSKEITEEQIENFWKNNLKDIARMIIAKNL